MSKSDEGPQSLSHKMLEVVHSACQETQQVLSELSTVGGGGGGGPQPPLFFLKKKWITKIIY